MMSEGAGQGAARWKRVVPWMGTAALLCYLGWTTDIPTVLAAFSDVNLPLVLGVALVGTATTFATDSLCVSLAFSRFVSPLCYREALPVKATSYFLNILNYNAALVGMALYVKRSKGAPFWKALGSLFFLNVTDILALCTTLAIGLVVTTGTDTLAPATLGVAWLIVVGGLCGGALGLLMLRLNIKIPVLTRIMKADVLAPLTQVKATQLLGFVGLRIFFLLQYFVCQYAFLHLFGITVPFARLLVYLPILTFIQIVPISISGLGTVQLVMRHFLSGYVAVAAAEPFAVVDACSTAAIFGFLLFRVLLAYAFLGKLSREVIAQAGSIHGREDDQEQEKGAQRPA